MKISPITFALAPLSALFSQNILAHEGHGVAQAQAFAHYMSEPIHLLPAILLIGVTAYAYIRAQRRKQDS